MIDTGIIILAAGSSSRFNGIKQLVEYNGKLLVEIIIDESIKTQLKPIVIITGANAELVSRAINHYQQIKVVFNEQWKQGMASGIIKGLSEILLDKKIRNVIIAVCDQPFISASLLQQLINTKNGTGKNIVACSYADTIGTPVLFAQKYFSKLTQLQGDEGAKKLLKNNIEDVAVIDFPQGVVDIDTRDDYQNLLGLTQQLFN